MLIGGQPAWRGTSAAAAANLAAQAVKGAEKIAKAAAAATAGAATPAGPALQTKLLKTAADVVTDMASTMASMPGDLHACPMLTVLIPHGPGMVMNPSQTVLIGGMGAARLGDMIQEATMVGSVAMGCPTVIIGG